MKIKTIVTAVATVVLTVTAARAQDWVSEHFYYDSEHKPTFNANEWSIDAFGTFLGHERHFSAFPNTSIRNGTWGGGVGGTYYGPRFLGIGVDTSMQDKSGPHFVDHVGGNLFLRLPIEPIKLAPYVFGGGGRAFNPTWNWYWNAGVGLEFRFNPKLGLFSDARYIWKDNHGGDRVTAARGPSAGVLTEQPKLY